MRKGLSYRIFSERLENQSENEKRIPSLILFFSKKWIRTHFLPYPVTAKQTVSVFSVWYIYDGKRKSDLFHLFFTFANNWIFQYQNGGMIMKEKKTTTNHTCFRDRLISWLLVITLLFSAPIPTQVFSVPTPVAAATKWQLRPCSAPALLQARLLARWGALKLLPYWLYPGLPV